MSLIGAHVLVTGATGFLGSTLALKLASEGALVRALVRTPSKAGLLRGIASIEPISGDVTDRDSLRRAAEDCAFVFHCAAAFTDAATQQRVNVEGTRNVAEVAAEAGVKRLIHVSTIAVYGYRPSGDVNESAPMVEAHGDPYNHTKIAGERAVTNVAAARSLSASIIRPGQMYGPRGGMWTQTLFRLARQRAIVFPGDGSGAIHAIHIGDVADLMIVMATHPCADGEAFNCAPDPAPTWRDMLLGYRRLAGCKNERWVGLPIMPLRAATKLAAALAPPHHQLRDATDLLAMLRHSFSFSTAKARERLGWTPRISLNDGIASCAPWLRAQGLLP